jgi:hypothetical protein
MLVASFNTTTVTAMSRCGAAGTALSSTPEVVCTGFRTDQTNPSHGKACRNARIDAFHRKEARPLMRDAASSCCFTELKEKLLSNHQPIMSETKPQRMIKSTGDDPNGGHCSGAKTFCFCGGNCAERA